MGQGTDISIIIFIILWGTGNGVCQEINENIEHEFIQCDSGTYEERIEKYFEFTKKYPNSGLSDDALVEISEIEIKRGELTKAREALENTKRKYPNGYKKQYIGAGDIDPGWIEDWEEYKKENPIKIVDYADYMLAKIFFEEEKYRESKKMLVGLIEKTRKPRIKAKHLAISRIKVKNLAILNAYDLREEALYLSVEVAAKLRDSRWNREIQHMLKREYGINREGYYIIITENDKMTRINDGDEKTKKKGKIDFDKDWGGKTNAGDIFILIIAVAGVIVCVSIYLHKLILRQ